MTATAGSIRFNTDSTKMEIYNDDKWLEIDSTSPAEQTGGTRGIWMGGASPSDTDRIDYASGSYMKGNIAVVMVYNRELTHAEMQQNFNAQRYRFGR